MTIQNIREVMMRIMSLNHNLNKESLLTLLSASGWDKEDIETGLSIFSENKKDLFASPIKNGPSFFDAKPQNNLINKIDINRIDEIDKDGFIEDENKTPPNTKNTENLNIEHNNTTLNANILNNQSDITNIKITKTPTPTFQKEQSVNLLRIIFFITTISIIMVGLYILLSNEMVRKSFWGLLEKQQDSQSNQTLNNTATHLPENTKQNISELGLLKQDILLNKKQITELENKITKLEKDKNVGQIKYISGSKGATGVGISKIYSNPNGFVFNYTNGKSVSVPFSTTTILQTINAQALCLNSTTTTQNLNASCLDQESLKKLLSF